MTLVDDNLERVEDDEVLCRRLPSGLGYKRQEDGTYRISASSFADRGRRPSVDRAKLRNYDAQLTRRDPSDGVASIVAAQVRGINVPTNDSEGRAIVTHALDIEPVPLEDNSAHAEIFAIPFPEKDKTFERIRTSLAQLARWEILPNDA